LQIISIQIMKSYSNKLSGISHYSIGEDFIDIKFKSHDHIYRYSYKLCGKDHIEQMKKLATIGKGLGTYINQHADVRDNFEIIKK
jgi:hypothetical protein